MLTVLLTAVVSISVAAFAMSVIMREFQGRWPQIAAALAFDERAFVGGDVRPTAAPRRARPATVQIRRSTSQRAAA